MLQVAVQDANILIDLELAQLLDDWFQLGIETHTTSLVARELRQGPHPKVLSQITSGRIVAHDLNATELGAVVRLQIAVGSSLSFSDCSVLFLAQKLDAMVLTGDGALRAASQIRQVQVHGTLWIMDALVGKGVIGGTTAATKLEWLIRGGRRLPKDACLARLARWRSPG